MLAQSEIEYLGTRGWILSGILIGKVAMRR
jgi:hypothetical protein